MADTTEAGSHQNALVIVGHGDSTTGELDELAAAISARLQVPVQPAYLDGLAPSIGEGIQAAVFAFRPQRVIVLPLFLGASAAKKNNVWMIVDAANERWSNVAAYYADPLGPHQNVVTAYSQLIDTVRQSLSDDISPADTALLVIGRGSSDADSNAEIAHMARLLWEGVRCGFVETAFYGSTQPDIATAITKCVRTGARRIICVPYLLYEGTLYASIRNKLERPQPMYPDIELRVSNHIGIDAGIVEAISQRYQEALIQVAIEDNGLFLPAPVHSHGQGFSHTHDFSASNNDLEALLPPRYQGGATVSAAPMGAADLVYDAQGNVAWDEIWGSFCDLAMAGGPPHRGTLLEPVTPDVVSAHPDAYRQVLAELERGIRLVTKLPVVASQSPGWIGIQCTDEEMALWLLRTIIVENVSVRREGDILFLPAGPNFRLEQEIKNVITVIAKTHHYWTEHLNGKDAYRT